MPCPYTGLNVDAASPSTTNPIWKGRHTVEVAQLVLGSPVAADRRHWDRVGEGVIQDRGAQRPGELDKAGLVGRRVVAANTGEGDVPQAAVEGKQPAASRHVGRPAGQQDRLPVALDPIRRHVHAARVAEEGVHDRVAWRRIPQCPEPGWRLRVPAAGVHDEVCLEIALRVVGPRSDGDAGDSGSAIGCQQRDHVMPLEYARAVVPEYPLPDRPIQKIARG